MNQQNEQGFTFSSYGILNFIGRWWKHIGAITFLGAATAIGASFLIPNRYQSSVVFYPTTTNSISKSLLERSDRAQDFLEFGQEEHAEQALQILQSDQIRDYVIRKYNLYQHYEIDTTKAFYKTKMYKKFSNNVNFRRTEFNSVEITVLDENPQMAADMANDIAAQLDSVKNSIQQKRALEGLKIVEDQYLAMQQEVNRMNDTLNKIRALGINDYVTQAEAMNTELAVALSKGNQKGAQAIQEKLDLLSKYGGAYLELTQNLEMSRAELASLKSKYQQAKVDAESNVPHKMIVNPAFPADRKTYPKRLYIAIGATIASFCMAIFFLIGLENVREYRQRLKVEKQESQA